jgi:hypothetical protein
MPIRERPHFLWKETCFSHDSKGRAGLPLARESVSAKYGSFAAKIGVSDDCLIARLYQ